MAEFSGMISWNEAMKENFMPGGANLHSMMTPHGLNGADFERAANEELKAVKIHGAAVGFLHMISVWSLGVELME